MGHDNQQCQKLISIMLENLDDLGKKMKNLIQTINEFEKEISTPYEAKKSNIRTSILVKVPKYLLLTKIIPYLSYRECQYLSNTCVFIRRTIYSPLGWKVMNEIHSPYQTIIVNPDLLKKPQFNRAVSYSSGAEDNLQDYEDQQFLVKERAKYKDTLWSKYKLHLSLKEKNQVLEEKVRVEKMYLFRVKLEKTFFQRQRDDLDEQNTKFREKLKKLGADFLSRDEKLAKRIDQIQEENLKLNKQKEALVCKIKQYQHEMPKIEQRAEVSKRTLKLLKDFVQNKDYEPLDEIPEDY